MTSSVRGRGTTDPSVASRAAGREGAQVPPTFFDIEDLLGIVSHCGRNLLGPIKGYASLIQDATGEEDNERRWADKIVRTAEVLEGYLARLGMYRVKGAVGVSDASWSALIESARVQCRAMRVPDARIIVENAATAAFQQHGELLKRVLFHLLANACEAAGRDGTVRVTVAERRVAGTDGIEREFEVRVADDGDGIDPAHADLIFSPHYSTRHDHAGLGLTSVAAAAPVLGMDVDVHSNPGEGTCVVLTLREARRQP